MPVYTVKSLQDPTDLRYISNLGHVPRFIQQAVEDSKSTHVRHVRPDQVDTIANDGLAQLWPAFKTPTKIEKRKRRFPIPFHPLLGMN